MDVVMHGAGDASWDVVMDVVVHGTNDVLCGDMMDSFMGGAAWRARAQSEYSHGEEEEGEANGGVSGAGGEGGQEGLCVRCMRPCVWGKGGGGHPAALTASISAARGKRVCELHEAMQLGQKGGKGHLAAFTPAAPYCIKLVPGPWRTSRDLHAHSRAFHHTVRKPVTVAFHY
eukprot:1150672-Pelagomonas_calceolata.AAC.3